jgi:hypothetical protein
MTKAHSRRNGGLSRKQKIRVFAGVPSTGHWRAGTARCVTAMFAEFTRRFPKVEIILGTQTLSMLVQSRHNLVVKALQHKATHMLFIDSDMVFPPDTLERLLARKKGVIAVNATTRTFPVKHIAHDKDGKVVDSRGKTGVEAVQHVGLAVALVETSVLQGLTPPLFLMDWIPNVRGYCGEDVYFCAITAEKGHEIFIDHDLSHEVGHVGDFIYGPQHIGIEMPEFKQRTDK